MSNYEIHAQPFFSRVTCPKHRVLMDELKTGFFEEKAWWCPACERPYNLKPVMMRKGTYNQEEIDKQINGLEKETK